MKTENHHLMFNPKYTFKSFIADNNDFACAAAKVVAKNPGIAHNPLFLYGGVGLGKTHLLHAIGQYVYSNNKDARIVFMSVEKLTNEYIDALQNNQLAEFRKHYRQADLLLIDDIQLLAGKERLQEEYFHIFNLLDETDKQIVMACSRPPDKIQGLEQRLVSRFEWGLVVDLQPPVVEIRLAILRQQAELMGLQVPDDILNFLADRIRSDVRRLEGALNHVASYATLTGKMLTIEVVEGLLRGIIQVGT